VLWYKRRICVPDDKEIKNLIIQYIPFTLEEIRCINILSFPTGGMG
jgi:hypothetical protein